MNYYDEAKKKLDAGMTDLGAELVQVFTDIYEKTVPILAEMFDAIVKGIEQIAETLVIHFDVFIEFYARAQGAPAKWFYIYRHTKKRRTRKKYKKLLTNAAIAYMEGRR